MPFGVFSGVNSGVFEGLLIALKMLVYMLGVGLCLVAWELLRWALRFFEYFYKK